MFKNKFFAFSSRGKESIANGSERTLGSLCQDQADSIAEDGYKGFKTKNNCPRKDPQPTLG